MTKLMVLGGCVCLASCGSNTNPSGGAQRYPAHTSEGQENAGPIDLSEKTDESADMAKQWLTVDLTYRVTEKGEVVSDTLVQGIDYNDEGKLLTLLKERAQAAGFDEKGAPRLKVKIRADGRVLYTSVQRVMALCTKVGIAHVCFGTKDAIRPEIHQRVSPPKDL